MRTRIRRSRQCGSAHGEARPEMARAPTGRGCGDQGGRWGSRFMESGQMSARSDVEAGTGMTGFSFGSQSHGSAWPKRFKITVKISKNNIRRPRFRRAAENTAGSHAGNVIPEYLCQKVTGAYTRCGHGKAMGKALAKQFPDTLVTSPCLLYADLRVSGSRVIDEILSRSFPGDI